MPRLWVTPDELEDRSSSPYAYEACQVATSVLWALSGRKFAGPTTVTETYECPCRGQFEQVFKPELVGGKMYNTLSARGCGCTDSHRVLRLRGQPVTRVHRVISRGVELSDSSYHVVNQSYLKGVTGAILDPCNTTVTYTYGYGPPVSGRRAARYLAQQLAAYWSGDDCELPERVTSVSRQGVSYTILDNQSFLDQFRTGIYAVDLFLKAVNPDGARKPAKVFSVDKPRAQHVTSTASRTSEGLKPTLGPFDFEVTPGTEKTVTLDLVQINGALLLDPNYAPEIQLVTPRGVTLLTIDSSRVTVNDVDEQVEFTLSADETALISRTGSASWDLYALGANNSVIHLVTGSVIVSQLVGA